MLHSATKHRTVIVGTIVAIAPLMTAQRASAHANHHGVDHTDSEATGEQSDLSSEPAPTEETPLAADKADSEANTTPPEQSSDAAIQEVPAAQTATATAEAGLFGGFSIGIGETLLALIIAGPFILISMKRKIHS